MKKNTKTDDGYLTEDGSRYTAEDAAKAILERRPHPKPVRDRLARRFIDGAPKTASPLQPDEVVFVERLIADGYRFDMAAGEWVSPDGEVYGRMSRTDSEIWLSEPATFKRHRVTSRADLA